MPAHTAPLSCPPAHALVPTTDLPWPLAHTETLGCPPDNTSPPPPPNPPNNTASSHDVVSHPSDTLSPEIPPAPPLPPRYPVRYRQPKVLTDGHIYWPPPTAHATSVVRSPLEPTSVTEALKHAD